MLIRTVTAITIVLLFGAPAALDAQGIPAAVEGDFDAKDFRFERR